MAIGQVRQARVQRADLAVSWVGDIAEMWRVQWRMSSAAVVGEIAVGRFMRCYRGKSRACGARRFFLLRTQALRPGLNCDAPPALRSGAGEEAGEAWRGHGCAVPLQRQDAAFGLGAPALQQAGLSDAPTTEVNLLLRASQ